jgi:hypothetical protein
VSLKAVLTIQTMSMHRTAGIIQSLPDCELAGNASKSRSGSWHRAWQAAIGAAIGALALLANPLVLAQEIRVDGGNCMSGVRLVAREAHLADVLKRLAQALDFQLSFQSESNPLVTIDATAPATELLARLGSAGNISMTEARNPACPQYLRIVNVWVLPNASAGPMRGVAPSSPARDALSEQARKGQQGIDLVLTSHGVAPLPEAKSEDQAAAQH